MPDFSEALTFMCVCLIPIATIIYEVFGIVYLVENYHNLDIPCVKHLWAYILVSLVVGLTHQGAAKYRETLEKNCSDLTCICLLNVGLALWGGIELANPVCEIMYDNPFWKFGLITFCLQASTSIFIILMSCCLSIVNFPEPICDEHYLYNQI